MKTVVLTGVSQWNLLAVSDSRARQNFRANPSAISVSHKFDGRATFPVIGREWLFHKVGSQLEETGALQNRNLDRDE
jgi:hypothetical protein